MPNIRKTNNPYIQGRAKKKAARKKRRDPLRGTRRTVGKSFYAGRDPSTKKKIKPEGLTWGGVRTQRTTPPSAVPNPESGRR